MKEHGSVLAVRPSFIFLGILGVAVFLRLYHVTRPLFIFYGRAVLPDPAMLPGMLGAACCYRRYLDGGRRRWWALALLAGGLGALFKYYGLMVLIPLADMERRRAGWRACCRWRF